MTGTRLPHSEIPGSKRACRSPRLIAACRVLPRLPSPRHPSCALTSLTTKKSIRIDCRISGAGALHLMCGAPAHDTRWCPVRAHSIPAVMPVQLSKSRPSTGLLSDPACTTRLAQCLLGTVLICPVSHSVVSDRRGLPPSGLPVLVGVPGVEPGTSSLSGTRSNQLSYTPIHWRRVAAYRPPVCVCP